MTSDEVNDTYLSRAAAMFAKVDGAPCVNLDPKSGEVHICRRLNDLSIDDDQLQGMCDWQDAEEDRPDELTDGLAISCD